MISIGVVSSFNKSVLIFHVVSPSITLPTSSGEPLTKVLTNLAFSLAGIGINLFAGVIIPNLATKPLKNFSLSPDS